MEGDLVPQMTAVGKCVSGFSVKSRIAIVTHTRLSLWQIQNRHNTDDLRTAEENVAPRATENSPVPEYPERRETGVGALASNRWRRKRGR